MIRILVTIVIVVVCIGANIAIRVRVRFLALTETTPKSLAWAVIAWGIIGVSVWLLAKLWKRQR